MTTAIDIAICTYRRPQLVDCLHSLATMTLPEGVALRVIVADNDSEPSAQTLVAKTAAELNLALTYVHAPSGNISIARNACLAAATGDFLAFIDDDQIASPGWLNAALTCMRDTSADVVLGPVRAVYPQGAPRWLIGSGFHDNLPAFVRGEIHTGYTGSTLMQRTSPAFSGLTFELAYGTTGGEDTDFFHRAHARGARIAYAPEAIMYEPVPPSRLSLRWLIRRRARYGQTRAATLRGSPHRTRHILLATTKALVCFAVLPAFFVIPTGWRYWLLRGVFHASVARALTQRA